MTLIEAPGRGQSLTAIHVAVPGRARLSVPGLKGSKSIKRRLESALIGSAGILAVSASTVTGNILVHYDRRANLTLVTETIEQLLRREGTGRSGDRMTLLRAGNWHLMQATQVLRRFRSSMSGLSPEVSKYRLEHHGANVLPGIRRRARLEMLLGQLQSLPVALLIGAAALSAATGGVADAVVIICVVALNTGIGYVTESQAERTISSLSKRIGYPVPVMRDGRQQSISVESAVPGDLLELRPGVVVAADARVVAANGLTLNEAMLTGESAPVLKRSERLDKPDVALAERSNMVYGGTIVTGGSGLAVVVATGPRTEIGHIQALIGEATNPETPLQRQLRGLGPPLVWIAGGACGLVFLIGLLRGYGLLQTVKDSIALAVAAVPEGLPTLATTTLALGVEQMRRRKVLVRRLEAVETLASVQVVCLDKTGTMTLNRMTIAEISCGGKIYRANDGEVLDREGQRVELAKTPELKRLAEIVALCNETVIARNQNGSELTGSPTESALVEFALNLGLDVSALRRQHLLLHVTYRSEQRLFMVTLHEAGPNRALAAVKGSPEEVLALCRWVDRGHEHAPMTEAERQSIEQQNSRFADDGQRVLGVAYAELPDHSIPHAGIPPELTWVGLIGMADPLRPGVTELLGVLRRAGISPVMITGDQRGTAAAIARKLDLGNGELRIFDSAEFRGVPELSQAPHVFARVTPAQKLQIVRALQHAGLVVAMTGDGVNDSPALKAADIGIAMGHSGSEAAREVAHIVLQDDNLMSLAPAIEQGRTTYNNIQKAIRFLLATNLSEILVMLTASAAGFGQPLAPAQLLWINLLSDVLPALALGLEPAEPNIMSTPPRDPNEAIIGSRDFQSLGRESALMSAGALAAYGYGVSKYGATSRTRTICLASLITAQLLHALTCRSRQHGPFSKQLPPNHLLSGVLAFSFLAQAGAMFLPPIRRLLGIAPIGVADALAALITGVIPFLANEALKASSSSGAEPIPEPIP